MQLFLPFCYVSIAFAQHGVNPVPVGAMHVQGNHIVDSTGRTIIFRGAEIPGLTPENTPAALTATTFSTMRQRYNMSVLRLPVASATDPLYFSRIDRIAKQANAA